MSATPAAPRNCVCNLSGHCWACLAAGRRCSLAGCRCTCADGVQCGSSPRPAARRAPAMPTPVLEGETSDESIPPMRTPTTAEGLTEALRASVSWASRPAARHAAARSLAEDAPEIVTPRVHELDRHERALVARRSGRAMRGVS